jgi:hypothetical protein
VVFRVLCHYSYLFLLLLFLDLLMLADLLEYEYVLDTYFL